MGIPLCAFSMIVSRSCPWPPLSATNFISLLSPLSRTAFTWNSPVNPVPLFVCVLIKAQVQLWQFRIPFDLNPSCLLHFYLLSPSQLYIPTPAALEFLWLSQKPVLLKAWIILISYPGRFPFITSDKLKCHSSVEPFMTCSEGGPFSMRQYYKFVLHIAKTCWRYDAVDIGVFGL